MKFILHAQSNHGNSLFSRLLIIPPTIIIGKVVKLVGQLLICRLILGFS